MIQRLLLDGINLHRRRMRVSQAVQLAALVHADEAEPRLPFPDVAVPRTQIAVQLAARQRFPPLRFMQRVRFWQYLQVFHRATPFGPLYAPRLACRTTTKTVLPVSYAAPNLRLALRSVRSPRHSTISRTTSSSGSARYSVFCRIIQAARNRVSRSFALRCGVCYHSPVTKCYAFRARKSHGADRGPERSAHVGPDQQRPRRRVVAERNKRARVSPSVGFEACRRRPGALVGYGPQGVLQSPGFGRQHAIVAR